MASLGTQTSVANGVERSGVSTDTMVVQHVISEDTGSGVTMHEEPASTSTLSVLPGASQLGEVTITLGTTQTASV